MDYVLGKTVSRGRLYAGYAGLVALVALAMQALTAAGFDLVARSVMDDPVDPWLIVKITFNYLPALWFMGGLGLFIVGWVKHASVVGWGYLVVSFLVVYMGGLADLPRWVSRLTPFGLVGRWPSEAFSWWGWIGLVVGAVVLTAVGAVGFRRRDVIA